MAEGTQTQKTSSRMFQPGLNSKSNCKKIGVSTQTVFRDLKRLEPYIRRQISAKRYLLEQQERERLNKLSEGLTFEQRMKYVSNLMCKTRKLSKKEEFEQHNKLIVLDMDNPVNGLPSVVMKNGSSTFKTPYHINLVVRKDGQPHVIGGIRIG